MKATKPEREHHVQPCTCPAFAKCVSSAAEGISMFALCVSIYNLPPFEWCLPGIPPLPIHASQVVILTLKKLTSDQLLNRFMNTSNKSQSLSSDRGSDCGKRWPCPASVLVCLWLGTGWSCQAAVNVLIGVLPSTSVPTRRFVTVPSPSPAELHPRKSSGLILGWGDDGQSATVTSTDYMRVGIMGDRGNKKPGWGVGGWSGVQEQEEVSPVILRPITNIERLI